MSAGLHGATENLYLGLSEFSDMAFTMHMLRPGDLFVDVGANVGAYTVLAAGVAGATCVAFEPVPATFAQLKRNVAVNALCDSVEARNFGVGERAERLRFSTSRDCCNHIVLSDENGPSTEVLVVALDTQLATRKPTLLKIDVEGFEAPVLRGAHDTLRNDSLLGIILETNGSGEAYGYSDEEVDRLVVGAGFTRCQYDPFNRSLRSISRAEASAKRNTIYVRRKDAVVARLASAPYVRVNGKRI